MPYAEQDPVIIRVVVQHRQRFYRDGLVLLLSGNPCVDVVGDVADAPALLRLTSELRPDVVVMEGDAPGWDGARLAAAIRRRRRHLRLVALVEAPESYRTQRSLRRAGIAAVVPATDGAEGLHDAVFDRRSATRSWYRPDAATPAAATVPCASLTRRELQVLSLVSAGHTTKETGTILAISAKTVESHKQRIFAKLDVQNQAHAVAVAMRNGLLSPAAALDAAAG